MSKATLLIVEDKFIVAQDLAGCLRKLGYTVAGICASGEEALRIAGEVHPKLVLMDIRLKGEMDGIEAAAKLRSDFEIPVVYLTAHSDEVTLERAAATTPSGYILKPFDERQLYTTIELALNSPRIQRGNFIREHPEIVSRPAELIGAPITPVVVSLREKPEFAQIIGSHPKMLQLLNNLELVAKTDITVHLYGENGTGKELVADALHHLSPRKDKPFIKLNCSAIPVTLLESALFGHGKGAFTGANKDQTGFIERAEGGTLFLDEIGDISLDTQVKLLRILQSREYNRVGESTDRKADIRIITATNKQLKELVDQSKMREDFYYRINVFPLEIPPLRDREEDILAIAHHYRLLFNRMFGKAVNSFTSEAEGAMLRYAWPGNVRQLENALRRAFVLADGDSIGVSHLPPEMASS